MSVDVAAIREALARATIGPWCVVDDQDWDEVKVIKGVTNRRKTPTVCTPICTSEQEGTADADLIVLLRNNAEALLDQWAESLAALDRVYAEAERRGAVKALRKFAETFDDAMAEREAVAIEDGADL